MQRMREAPCLHLELETELRVELLLADYATLSADRPLLHQRLASLRALRGAETVSRWQDLIDRGELATFTADILQHHYDPSYLRSMGQNFHHFNAAPLVTLKGIDAESFQRAAEEVLAITPEAAENPPRPSAQTQAETVSG